MSSRRNVEDKTEMSEIKNAADFYWYDSFTDLGLEINGAPGMTSPNQDNPIFRFAEEYKDFYVKPLETERDSLLRLHKQIAQHERERRNFAHRIKNQRLELDRLQKVDSLRFLLLTALKLAVAEIEEYSTINNLSVPGWIAVAKNAINKAEE